MNNNPTILWAQDRENLFITIEIVNFNNQGILFNENNILVSGVSENREYNINIDLHNSIEGDGSTWNIRQNKVELKVKKNKSLYWQKLTKNKQNNIRIDWQKWKDEDEEEDEIINDFSNFTKQLPEDFLNKDFSEFIPEELSSNDIENLEIEDGDDNEGDIDTDDNTDGVENNDFNKIGGLEVLEKEELILNDELS